MKRLEINKIENGKELSKVAENDKLAVMVIHNKYYCTDLFFLGKPLEYVAEEMSIHIELMIKFKQEFDLSYTKIWQQLIFNLQGKSTKKLSPRELDFFRDKSALYFNIYLANSIWFYFKREYDKAFVNIQLAEKYAEGSWENRCFFQYNFYYSLILTAKYLNTSQKERQELLNRLRENQEEMKKWTDYAPKNYLHKYQLIEAEKARILAENIRAKNYYDRAIEGAKKSGYIHEEAIANELASEFYLACNKEKIARSYLNDAYNNYLYWQAGIKVNYLQEKYPQLIKITGKKASELKYLELSSVIKASRAISSENILEKLLNRLIKIVMENAGAQKSFLFLEKDDSLILVAVGVAEEKIKISFPQQKIENYPHLPISIINDVYRRKEILIIDRLNAEKLFVKDAYIASKQPKSILGLPIMYSGQLKGILYLENCLVEFKLNKERLEILKMLTSQLSISLENNRLYRTISYRNLHDILTNLPNRQFFEQELSLAIVKANKNKASIAVLFIGLDRFKKINDNLTHKIGDKLLQNFARRLKSYLQPVNILARWEGDEFTILMETIKSKEEAIVLAEKIINCFKQPFKLEKNLEIHVSNSIGIAIYPQDGKNAEILLSNADAALSIAKKIGGGNYQFYNQKIHNLTSNSLKLESYLYGALERQEFFLYYQPQINIKTGKIYGVEALIRWKHSQLGLISPDRFIPIAEETGLIIPIGEWVLKTACIQSKIWQNAGLSPLKISVNISPRQLQQKKLLEMIEVILRETQIQPNLLELEITENTAIRNPELASKILWKIAAMGINISMDDFGVGYSCLGYLKKFPFHGLKLDRLLIKDLPDKPEDIAIVTAAIALGKGFNLRIVVEGVETVQQLNLLYDLECEYIQGYIFSKPLDTESMTQFLIEDRNKAASCILPS